ncbi:MAG: hypothetical protein ACREV1_13320 [Gammaproteobacteria bacterium]
MAFAQLSRVLGVDDPSLLEHLISQLAVAYDGYKQYSIEFVVDAALAAVQEIEPHDGVEAMLAVQMVAVHNAAMGFLRKATLPEQTFEGVDANVNRAAKLLRTYVAQVEALSRLRTKGQQTIKVEHVTVESGGQAVVGNVQLGGGGMNENER